MCQHEPSWHKQRPGAGICKSILSFESSPADSFAGYPGVIKTFAVIAILFPDVEICAQAEKPGHLAAILAGFFTDVQVFAAGAVLHHRAGRWVRVNDVGELFAVGLEAQAGREEQSVDDGGVEHGFHSSILFKRPSVKQRSTKAIRRSRKRMRGNEGVIIWARS